MQDEHISRTHDMRALARNLFDLAALTTLADYRIRLLLAAARLTDAANALETVARAGRA